MKKTPQNRRKSRNDVEDQLSEIEHAFDDVGTALDVCIIYLKLVAVSLIFIHYACSVL